MPKDPKKTIRIMMILCIFIGLAALAVAIKNKNWWAYDLAKEEYIITTAMLLVGAWQIVNYRKWKKNL